VPVIIWMAVIFGASTDLMSTQHTSRFTEPLLRWIKPDISDEAIRRAQFTVRKTAHAVEYAILAALVWRARRKSGGDTPRPWLWAEAKFAVLFSACYAALDELHQHFVPSRQGSIGDVLLDTFGAVLGVLLIWQVGRRLKRW
jgi:VanZ family protein